MRKRRTKQKADWITILRYGILVVLVIYVAALLFRAGGSNTPFERVAAAVDSAIQKEDMDRADSQDIKKLYGLNERDQDGVLLYYQKATMGVEEILLVRAATERGAQEIADMAAARRDTQIGNFEGYGPEQVKLLRDSILKIRGNYVLFVVSPEAEEIEAAFDKAL